MDTRETVTGVRRDGGHQDTVVEVKEVQEKTRRQLETVGGRKTDGRRTGPASRTTTGCPHPMTTKSLGLPSVCLWGFGI